MKTSQSVAAISAALAKAQGSIKGAAKDRINPHFKSAYADLASVWEACRTQLAANEIAVVQGPEAEGAKVTVTTLLTHKSGEWMESSLSVAAAQNTPQGIGSAITYARRYGLAAMVGVAPEDDDAEAAEGRETKPEPNAKKSDDAAAKVREAMKTPAFRKQEAIRELAAMGLNPRVELKNLLGRTFPEGQDIKLQNEEELEQVERHVALTKSHHNGAKSAH